MFCVSTEGTPVKIVPTLFCLAAKSIVILLSGVICDVTSKANTASLNEAVAAPLLEASK